MKQPQQGKPREEPSAGKENPVWVLLPGQVGPDRGCDKALAWTSGGPHRAYDAPDEVGAEPMIPAAAEGAKRGDPSPDAFKRHMTRRQEERKRQNSTACQ